MSDNIAHKVTEEAGGHDYMAHRSLKKGAAGWVLLAGLGISYVISGDFSGWNLGLELGGWGGMLIGAILMAIMYTFMVLSIAELSASLPAAGGGYSFASRAMGRTTGYLTGIAILLEYMIAPAAIVIFIGGYVESLIGINGSLVYAVFYAVFVGIHLLGAGEALKLMMGITAIAVVALIVTFFGLIPHFDTANLFDITEISTTAAGASSFLPNSYMGIWASIPFAMWLFLAVEGVPMAAEEAGDPAKDMPRGIITAMIVLLVFGAAMLIVVPGAAGAKLMGQSGAPLVDALNFVGNDGLAKFVNIAGLAGLIASFFSIIYGYSRQIFALSRAGYIPTWLSVTTKKKVPARALIIPGIIGFIFSLSGEGDQMMTIAVFGATISYALMCLSHIMLRIKEPNMERPYKTPGGIFTSGIAFALAIAAFISTFLSSFTAAILALVFYGIMIAYYLIYSKNHLVFKTPEEEFKALHDLESDLG